MKGKIKIYCEGVTDQLFVADCIETWFPIKLKREKKKSNKKKWNIYRSDRKVEIKEIGGCDMIRETGLVRDEMIDNTELGGVNILIFDADYTGKENGNKGIEPCRQKMNGLRKAFNLEFEQYIWPNNQEDGVIEHIIREMIPKEKKGVMDCIEVYAKCIEKHNGFNLRVPDQKNVLSSYAYVHDCGQNQPSDMDYKANEIWNLNHKEIPYLENFKLFLERHIS
jgi:hypothetical protein